LSGILLHVPLGTYRRPSAWYATLPIIHPSSIPTLSLLVLYL